MKGTGSGTKVRMVIGVALAGCSLAGVGCKTVKKADYEAAVAENTELRGRIETLQDSVRQSEADKDALRNENASLSSQLSQAKSQPAGRAGLPTVAGAGVSARGSDIVVTVAGDVLFASGQATLTREGRGRLDNVAEVIRRQYSGNTIRVEGYTDTDPIRKSKWVTNERLSAERALAVEAYLVGKGISGERIYSAAFGPSGQKSSKAASRRVEIVILDGI